MYALLLSAAAAVLSPAAPPAPVVVAAPPVAAPAPVALPPVDPARLAVARTTANALFADGSMARMFDKMLTTKSDGGAGMWLDMTLNDLMTMVGQGGKLPKDSPEANMTFRQMMAKSDPYFEPRMAAIHDAVVAEAIRLGPKFEPQLREGLATSIARRFALTELTDMARFFATPAGRAFGEQMYLMWADPAVIRSMMSAMPGLAAELPAAMQRVKAANDRYPMPKREVSKPEPAPKKPVQRRKRK